MRLFFALISVGVVATAISAGCGSTDLVIGQDNDALRKGQQACADVGGRCAAITPASCAGGRWLDAKSDAASKVNCGGVGVGCCVGACPAVAQPSADFCVGGTVKPRVDPTGCTVGFDCDMTALDGGSPNACVLAGGSCVGISPSSCAGGRWGDASKLSCGSGVGVGCCLAQCPELAPPPPGFCDGGTVKPRVDATGCTVGFDCDATALDGGSPNACVLAGGSCVGISPSSCPNGRWGDASKLSCGSGVGVGCCLAPCPVLAPPPPGFCDGGTVKPRVDPTGCTVGFDCEATALDGGSPNACVLAGGRCVAANPALCADGKWGDPKDCGGGVGIGCCLP